MNKIINVILFIIQCLGGNVNIRRLYLYLYLADTRHLSRHGALITGDTYIAMKHGPMPFYILGLYRKLKAAPLIRSINGRQRLCLSIDDKQEAVAHIPCDTSCLAGSEVESIFEVIHEYKDTPMDVLLAKAMNKAWQDADMSGQIAPADMAAESGATPDMIRYIELSYLDEMNSFDPYEPATKER